MKPLRILVADDHDLVRHGVKAMLVTHPGWEVCAEATTGREAVAKAEQLKPDIAILDIGMPEMNGLDAARAIQKALPETEILILSMHHSDQLIRELVDIGVRGYIVKSDSERDLIVAVENLANHKPFFATRVTDFLLRNFNSGKPKTVLDSISRCITPREREIVQLLAEGKSNREVASALGISVKTAETHRANVMRKLKIHTISELVLYALHNEIVEA
jgi:DNA-binding NarL/FixJ family response regulator